MKTFKQLDFIRSIPWHREPTLKIVHCLCSQLLSPSNQGGCTQPEYSEWPLEFPACQTPRGIIPENFQCKKIGSVPGKILAVSPGVIEFATMDLGSQSADRDCRAGLRQICLLGGPVWLFCEGWELSKVGWMKYVFMCSLNIYSVITVFGLWSQLLLFVWGWIIHIKLHMKQYNEGFLIHWSLIIQYIFHLCDSCMQTHLFYFNFIFALRNLLNFYLNARVFLDVINTPS